MTAGNSAVALVAPQAEETPAELKAIRDLYAKDLSDVEWDLFCAEARHWDLSVVMREIVAVKRKGRVTHQVTIHGARRLAERSQMHAGSDGPYWCGPDGVWKDVWLAKEPPAAAKFSVYRYDSPHPYTATVLWSERAQSYWQNGREQLFETWEQMPAHMLAKVAESDALKKARLLTGEVPLDVGPLPGEYSPKVMALRRLHAVGAERGLDHGGVREVVKAIAPGTESLGSEAIGARELNSAAAFVEDADDCDLTGAVAGMVELTPLDVDDVGELAMSGVDPETGEITDDVVDEDAPRVNPKLVGQWLENIDRADTVRKFRPIEKTIRLEGLDRVAEIASALAIKRGELGLPEDDAMARVDRAVDRAIASGA
jgi:hypothetical protein